MLCVYHDPKFRHTFEFLSNRLREKTLPGHLTRRFGKAVCCCHLTPDGLGKVLHIEAWLQEMATSGKYDEEVQKTLKNAFSSLIAVETPEREKLAKKRLLDVVRKLEEGNYSSFLKDEQQPDGEFPTSFTKRFNLNLRSANVGLLIGSKGNTLKAISSQHDANIHVSTGRLVSVRITAAHLGSIDKTHKALNEKVKTIEEKRGKHLEAVRNWCQRKSLMRQNRGEVKQYVLSSSNLSGKELDQDSYQMKVKMSQKLKLKGVGKSLGVLEESGSRCLHCMVPFYKGRNDVGGCCFHAGFVVDGIWSCCQAESAEGCASQEEHAGGCTYGRHVWRQGKLLGKGRGGCRIARSKRKMMDVDCSV
eukprot:m.310662 g.310662  ORF g.310662 m.310662 type:complete len:361 (+) comp53608_c0_seq1:134-1216(+)